MNEYFRNIITRKRPLPASVGGLMCLLVFLSAGWQLSAAPEGPKGTETVRIRGQISNGTTGRNVSVPKLELIDPSGGMRPIATLENAGPSFEFPPVPRPQGPLLVRAHFLDETYVKLIPPTERMWAAVQQVEVFDSAPLPADVIPRAALQVTKEQGRLLVSRIIAVHNKSRTTYKTDTLQIFVPRTAENLRGTLQQEGSNMPVPLTLVRNGENVRIGRGLRPGNAAITLEYTVKGTELTDSQPQNTAHAGVTPLPGIVWWRPADARPRVSGASAQDLDTGKLGPALRVQYPSTGIVTYDFSAGGFAPPSERFEMNPIFDSKGTTMIGVILFTLAFLAIVAVAVGSGFRLVRSGTPAAESARPSGS